METSTAQITYHPSSPSPLAKKETRMEKQNQEKSEKPAMASQEETTPRCRPGVGDDAEAEAEADASVKPEDFEFCILAPGGLVEDAAGADMCVAGEVFSGGKLVPFRLSSVASADALLLLRSDSLDSSSTTTGAASTSDFSSSSDSGSTSFSSSSSGLSRSASLKSASSSADSVAAVGLSHSPAQNDPACAARSLTSSSWFYAHPSPSPRPPQRRRTGGSSSVSAARRRSTGSAAPPPAAAWGVISLGVVGAPELVCPPAKARKAARSRGGVISRSGRLDQPRPAAGNKEQPLAADKKKKKKKKKKKLVFGLLGAGLACSCSADDVAPRLAAARRRQRRKAEQTKKGVVDSGHGGAVLGSSSGRRSSSQLPNAKSKNSVKR